MAGVMLSSSALPSSLSLAVREERAPLLAAIAPLLYLGVCALAVRSVTMDSSVDVGLTGLLLAIGLVPAFAIPAVFSTRNAKLAIGENGLVVDGRTVKLDTARIERADRGAGRLILETRGGETRTFLVPSYADAQALVAQLPPISAPAGALNAF